MTIRPLDEQTLRDEHQIEFLRGELFASKAVSHNLTFYENDKLSCFALQVA